MICSNKNISNANITINKNVLSAPLNKHWVNIIIHNVPVLTAQNKILLKPWRTGQTAKLKKKKKVQSNLADLC